MCVNLSVLIEFANHFEGEKKKMRQAADELCIRAEQELEAVVSCHITSRTASTRWKVAPRQIIHLVD